MQEMLQVMDKRALGVRIAQLRKKAKLSQEELAPKAGVGRGTIQALETGGGNPTLDTLIAIADYFKITFEDLCGMAPPLKLRPKTAKPNRSPIDPDLFEASRLLGAVARASADRRAIILGFAYDDSAYFDALEPDVARALEELVRAL